MILKPKKNHTKPENYRPVTLLVTMFKVFEKTILNRLKLYIKPRTDQHAFRLGHLTITQLINLIDNLALNTNKKDQTAAIFLDVAKAFIQV